MLSISVIFATRIIFGANIGCRSFDCVIETLVVNKKSYSKAMLGDMIRLPYDLPSQNPPLLRVCQGLNWVKSGLEYQNTRHSGSQRKCYHTEYTLTYI